MHLIAPLLRSAALALALSAPAVAGASSLSGAYLAAMQADFRDDYVEAADYYDRALGLDPENFGILMNAVVARVALGDVATARNLADRLDKLDAGNQIATLVRLADTLAAGNFDQAGSILAGAGEEGINPLLGGMLAGWVEVGKQDYAAAAAKFDAMNANDALAAYGQYHKALALAFAGDFVSSAAILEGDEDGPLHLNRTAIIAHAQVLAQIGREADAVKLLDEALAGGVPDAPIIALRDRLAAGEEVPFDQITQARDGAAEAFLTLADAINTSDSQRVALMHARIAGHIRPDLTEADLLAAEILEAQGQFPLATEALAAVPAASPWYVTAQIRRATTQRAAPAPRRTRARPPAPRKARRWRARTAPAPRARRRPAGRPRRDRAGCAPRAGHGPAPPARSRRGSARRRGSGTPRRRRRGPG